MKKTIIVLLAMAGLSLAGPKSYDVTFGATAVLGSMEVESGQYRISFDGSNLTSNLSKVTLVNENTRKSVETTATVQTSAKKYSETVVHFKRVDGKDLVDEIEIGGTRTALDFKR